MKDKLYKLMNWPAIEAIVYGEDCNPQEILGCHKFGSNTYLYQTFLPDAKEVSIFFNETKEFLKMELVDELGFFAVAVTGKQKVEYQYQILYKDETTVTIKDPYQFLPSFSSELLSKLNCGTLESTEQILGAHFVCENNVLGVRFTIWAPNALYVSLTGDFNRWNRRANPMMKVSEAGLFTLFIPDFKEDSYYKYNVLVKGGETYEKTDPYAFSQQYIENGASKAVTIPNYSWTDASFLKQREKINSKAQPVSIYEVDPQSFVHEDGTFIPYSEWKNLLLPYLEKNRVTHIEILPITEYQNTPDNSVQMTALYAISSRFGSIKDFMNLINAFHSAGIAVILDWVPAWFPNFEQGLCHFDGTCLYGHLDERKRYNKAYNGCNYNYARPQVSAFLQSNALFLIRTFHIDGLRFCGLSSMLYLDYGKSQGEWSANLYGGNENLEAISFIKELNNKIHKEYKGVITIAKETSAYPGVTQKTTENGLGFDYIWNTGYIADCISYFEKSVSQRKINLSQVTMSMLYAYSENYILPLSHNLFTAKKDSLVQYMQGDTIQKEMNLRLFLTYLFCHPGKKMIFEGQEMIPSVNRTAFFDTLNFTKLSAKATSFYESLNQFYHQTPALYTFDSSEKGFEWIHCMNQMDGVITFLRKTSFIEETILVVCNFSDQAYKEYKLGLPYEGKYKPIFHSNEESFGGNVILNHRSRMTKEEAYDGRINSLSVSVSPLSISVYSYKPYTKEELLKMAEQKAAKIRKSLEREALKKAQVLQKISLREELSKKVLLADDKISSGTEVMKEISVKKK